MDSVLDDEGWFPTGDLAHIDDEGYLFIEGRADDTIIRGGENVAPAEIETVLLRHPAVAECAVVGLPDEEWGQRIAAVVVTADDATEDELRAWCREHLRGSKTPDHIEFRAETALHGHRQAAPPHPPQRAHRRLRDPRPEAIGYVPGPMRDGEPLSAELQAHAGAELERAGVPGAALAVVDGAGAVATAAFGRADVATDQAVGTETVFHLFSATKLYTAAAVVVLAEQGRLGSGRPGGRPTGRPGSRPPGHDPPAPHPHVGPARHLPGLRRRSPPRRPGPVDGRRRWPGTTSARASRRAPRSPTATSTSPCSVRWSRSCPASPSRPSSPAPYWNRSAPAPASRTRMRQRAQAATGYLGRWDPMRPALPLLLPGTRDRLTQRPVDGLVGLHEFGLDSAAIGGLVGAVGGLPPLPSGIPPGATTAYFPGPPATRC